MQTARHKEFEDERTLVAKCADWDRDAQNFLYKKFAARMFTVCMRYSKSREEAEDTLQEGFLKVFENISKYRGDGSLEGWIRRIMYHAAIEKFRKRKNEDEVMEEMKELTGENQPDSANIEATMNSKELVAMIQKLTPKYRMVFNLYVFEGLSHKEIASELNISEGTSKSNLSDARRILQRLLKQHS